MYLVGRKVSKNETINTFYNNRIDTTVKNIRSLTDDAINYFTTSMEERERIGLTVNIHNNIRRISTDISDVAKHTKHSENTYLTQWTRYYNSITDEPFGDSNFEPYEITNNRIENIRIMEENLIVVIRSMFCT